MRASFNAQEWLGASDHPSTLNQIRHTGWKCDPAKAPEKDPWTIVGKQGGLTNNKLGIQCQRNINNTSVVVGGHKLIAGQAKLTFDTQAGLFDDSSMPSHFKNSHRSQRFMLAPMPR